MTKAKELLKMANNEAYGDKRDFKKIDIYYDGKYMGSTNWAKSCKEAVDKYFEQHKDDVEDISKLKASFSKNESLLEGHQVGATILQQLGGNKFIAMTGAKNFIGIDDNTIGFKIGRNAKGVNYVKIHLNGMDTYDMEFLNVRAGNVKTISKADGIFNDMLQDTFTEHTGLYTSLGTMGRNESISEGFKLTIQQEHGDDYPITKKFNTREAVMFYLKNKFAKAHDEFVADLGNENLQYAIKELETKDSANVEGVDFVIEGSANESKASKLLGLIEKVSSVKESKINIQKVKWVMDLLTNDESSSDEELADWFIKEGQMDLDFAKELVEFRTFGDMRKEKGMESFVYDNADKIGEGKTISKEAQVEENKMSKIDKLLSLIESSVRVANGQGGIDYDPSTGYCKMDQPGWYSTDLHPLAAYRVGKKYFKNYEDFKAQLEITKVPQLRVSGDNINDAYFILFGGRDGYDNIMEVVEEGIPEGEENDKFIKVFDEDTMIEQVWKNIFNSTDEANIATWIEGDNVSEVYETVRDYIFEDLGVDVYGGE